MTCVQHLLKECFAFDQTFRPTFSQMLKRLAGFSNIVGSFSQGLTQKIQRTVLYHSIVKTNGQMFSMQLFLL